MSFQINNGPSLACDDLGQCMQADLVKVPKTVFSLRERLLPLTDTQFDAEFGPEINFFAGSASQRALGVSSNTTLTNAVDVPFLIRCISVFISVEPLGFTASGAAIAAPSTPVFTPYFDGVLTGIPAAQADVPGMMPQPAWLEWGQGTWKAAHAFMQAYRMTMVLGGRLELFNELNADVGNLDSHSPWEGFSNSLSNLPAYVRQVNDKARADGRSSIFLPATAQQVTIPAQAPFQALIGVPAPLVQASWGGPQQKGLFCGCYPVRGLLLVPGAPINLNMVRDKGDSIYFAALRDALTVKSGLTYDANLTATLALQTAAGPPPVLTTISNNSAFQEFKGGKLRIGISMRGFELTPRAAIQWYGMYSNSFGLMYMNAQAAAALTELVGVAGVPGGLAGIQDWMDSGAGLPQETAQG